MPPGSASASVQRSPSGKHRLARTSRVVQWTPRRLLIIVTDRCAAPNERRPCRLLAGRDVCNNDAGDRGGACNRHGGAIPSPPIPRTSAGSVVGCRGGVAADGDRAIAHGSSEPTNHGSSVAQGALIFNEQHTFAWSRCRAIPGSGKGGGMGISERYAAQIIPEIGCPAIILMGW